MGAAVIALATMALFAAIVFLPLMFQLLMDASPTQAGLMLAPMMGGVIVASVVGGRLVSRTGRYKIFPVFGLLAATLSYAALGVGRAPRGSPAARRDVLVVMGLGIGLVMPNLTTAIQNAVPRRDLGAATAAAAFFRSLGGALGAALAGAVLAAHLHGPIGDLGHLSSGVLADCRASRCAARAGAGRLSRRAVRRFHGWGGNRRARFPGGAFLAGTPAARRGCVAGAQCSVKADSGARRCPSSLLVARMAAAVGDN